MLLKNYIFENLKIIKENNNIESNLDEKVKEYTGQKNYKRLEMLEGFLKAVDSKYSIFTHIGIEIERMRGNNISFGPKGPTGNVANPGLDAIMKMIKSSFLFNCAVYFGDKDNIEYCNNHLGGRFLHRGGKTIHMWAIKYKNKKVGFDTLQSLHDERIDDDAIETDEDVDKIMEPFRLLIYQAPSLNQSSVKGSINPLTGKYFKLFVPLSGGSDSIPGWDEVYK